MSEGKLLNLVEDALEQLEQYVIMYDKGISSPTTIATKRVLLLLKEDVTSFPEINGRLLRATHDMSVAAVKVYDGTPLEEALLNVIRELYKIPGYSKLEPLRGDFGKGTPV